MQNWKRQRERVLFDETIQSPLILEAELFNFPKLLFIFFLMLFSQIFDNLKHGLVNVRVLVIHARN